MPETAHPDEPRLPQEICDLIVDYNHSDRATLKTLALVSRAWLASARYHIFYSIHIVTDLELLGSGVAPLNFKDDRSISLLGMGPPSSFPVRHLIVGKSNILGALREPSSIESIFAIMAHFPRVHSLSLKHIYIEDDVTDTVTKLKTSFTTFPSRLHMLELSRFFRVRAIRPISDIIRMFTSISYLKLDHLYRNAESFEHEPWHDYPTPPSHKIPVDRLDFELSRVQDVPVFMEDLYSAVDVANVGCLGLTYLTEVVPPEFIKLVETSSGRLTSLIVKTHG
ncbi:hypothetical protein EUX98_g7655 [Antrodiella citrinella]|uniref:F-box domain-containing protein n=1 Tax=Antrodiella citrinella TaxID=2447956 RepID=A0A4S4MMV0_9APHY|nr:hypothetical protein EUX98_g7655 [Antrodiella citrinella]